MATDEEKAMRRRIDVSEFKARLPHRLEQDGWWLAESTTRPADVHLAPRPVRTAAARS